MEFLAVEGARRRFFKRAGPFLLGKLAALSGSALIRGDKTSLVEDVSSLQEGGEKDLAVLHNPKYMDALRTTGVGVCIVKEAWVDAVPKHASILVCDKPYKAFAKVAQAFYPRETSPSGVAASAKIDPRACLGEGCRIAPGVVIEAGAVLGKGCNIGPNSLIGEHVVLGEDCTLEAHVTLTHAILGDRVWIKPGARIGQQGFGFSMEDLGTRGYTSVPQLGIVRIGNDVEVGANTTIDRGSLRDTILEDHVRIDNLVQVAHNVTLGRGSVVVAQVGISGSTLVGADCVFGGQVGLSGHLCIASGTHVAAKSGVLRDTGPGEVLAGIPAVPIQDWRRQCIRLKKLGKKGDSGK